MNNPNRREVVLAGVTVLITVKLQGCASNKQVIRNVGGATSFEQDETILKILQEAVFPRMRHMRVSELKAVITAVEPEHRLLVSLEAREVLKTRGLLQNNHKPTLDESDWRHAKEEEQRRERYLGNNLQQPASMSDETFSWLLMLDERRKDLERLLSENQGTKENIKP